MTEHVPKISLMGIFTKLRSSKLESLIAVLLRRYIQPRPKTMLFCMYSGITVSYDSDVRLQVIT